MRSQDDSGQIDFGLRPLQMSVVPPRPQLRAAAAAFKHQARERIAMQDRRQIQLRTTDIDFPAALVAVVN